MGVVRSGIVSTISQYSSLHWVESGRMTDGKT
nr:MAG TPA: hypothetical protein [Bacteriophage sp.]